MGFKEVRGRLSAGCDALNAEFAAVEYELADLKLGVRTMVPMSGGAYLAFGRVNGTWRITCGVRGVEEVPVVTCSLEVRVEAVGYVDALFASMLGVAESRIGDVEQATVRLREFRAGVRAIKEAE